MAQCKWCGRSGWFLFVDQMGLCSNCLPIVAMDIKQRGRIINDSLKLVRESKKIDTRLTRCDLIVQHASALTNYERHGIPTYDPLPSKLVREFGDLHDEIILDYLKSEFEDARTKVGLSSSVKNKVSLLSKVLLKIRELKKGTKSPAILDPLELQIYQLIHEVQLAGYLDEAKKAEFKGQKRKALDQYYEALYFLKHDEIDDSLQKEHIGFIESKIGELGGAPAAEGTDRRGDQKESD